jgi:hypothetical protein
MSWLALQNATRNDRSASAPGWAFGSENAIAAMTRKSAAWVTSIHPRRRPRNGGTNRSINGDQRYLIVYGSPTREKMPITVRSTFSDVIHAWSVEPVNARGIPEEKPRRRTKKTRRFPNAFSSADMGSIVPSSREGEEEERGRRLFREPGSLRRQERAGRRPPPGMQWWRKRSGPSRRSTTDRDPRRSDAGQDIKGGAGRPARPLSAMMTVIPS